MYLRMVHVRYKPDSLSRIQDVYEKTIIPRLEKTEGCLCVCAIVSDKEPDEGISLTIWNTKEHAEAYEQSGLYQKLLAELEPCLDESSEWKMQLTKDLVLDYQPEEKEPAIKTYTSSVQMKKKLPEQKTDHMYLRIVSHSIQAGKTEEYKEIYTQEIIPALQQVKGCRFAFLTENMKEQNSMLSITLWDSRQDTENYEKSGLFSQLKAKLAHTFSDLYQWKIALEKEYVKHAITSDDLRIDSYRVITGKSFQ